MAALQYEVRSTNSLTKSATNISQQALSGNIEASQFTPITLVIKLIAQQKADRASPCQTGHIYAAYYIYT